MASTGTGQQQRDNGNGRRLRLRSNSLERLAAQDQPPAQQARAARDRSNSLDSEDEDEPFALPPNINTPAYNKARKALGRAGPLRGIMFAGGYLCCSLCGKTTCDLDCIMRMNSLEEQALYEYVLLHEPFDTLPVVQGEAQQIQAARDLAVSSRTRQQMRQDLEEARQLWELGQVSN